MALEVKGQVHRLLKEATSDANLLQMYVGWFPMC
jgi:phosphatidylinositol kinase/protein kinase (PI-3  family)